jgi:diaminopimelate decarboxylase
MSSLPATQHQFVKKFLHAHKAKLFELVNAFGPVIHFLFPEIFEENTKDFQKIFSQYAISGEIFYALKANKSEAFLEIAAKNNIGVEASSIFEFRKALGHGIIGQAIISSGPHKNDEFLLLSIQHNATISIDSLEEIFRLIKLTTKLKTSVQVLLRVNNVINKISRFGIPIDQLAEAYKTIKTYNTFIKFIGFSFHLDGYSIQERSQAINQVLEECFLARKYGLDCNVIDIGGGFTIKYIDKIFWNHFLLEREKYEFYQNKTFLNFYPYFSEYVKNVFLEKILQSPSPCSQDNIASRLKKEAIKLFIEPGRSLLDQTGITAIQVKGITQNAQGDDIIVVDGNINHLSEQWFNTDFLPDPILISLEDTFTIKEYTACISGNTCMESDLLTWRKIKFQKMPMKGDLLVYINTAGYQMDSNESTFHLLPIPQKIAIYGCNNEKYSWKKDDGFSLLDIVE